jgi:hypothetical protein
MSSINKGRVSKRMHQACENCRWVQLIDRPVIVECSSPALSHEANKLPSKRRKKTRCPGEKPACSTCARLFQVCRYSGGNGTVERMQENGGGVVCPSGQNRCRDLFDLSPGNTLGAARREHGIDPGESNVLATLFCFRSRFHSSLC